MFLEDVILDSDLAIQSSIRYGKLFIYNSYKIAKPITIY